MWSMLTTFHLQTNGQTERINHIIEAYLRSDCNVEQNDWTEMLPMAGFDYSNSKHSSTKILPSYANYSYEPQTNWPTEIQSRNPACKLYGQYLTTVHPNVSGQLEAVRESMSWYFNKNWKPIEKFKKGMLVTLNGKNIRSEERCPKL